MNQNKKKKIDQINLNIPRTGLFNNKTLQQKNFNKKNVNMNLIREVLIDVPFDYVQGMSDWLYNIYIYLKVKNKYSRINNSKLKFDIKFYFENLYNKYWNYSDTSNFENHNLILSLFYSLLEGKKYFGELNNDMIQEFIILFFLMPLFLSRGPLFIFFNTYIEKGDKENYIKLMDYIVKLTEEKKKSKPMNISIFTIYVFISIFLKKEVNFIKMGITNENFYDRITSFTSSNDLKNKIMNTNLDDLIKNTHNKIKDIEKKYGSITNYLNKLQENIKNNNNNKLITFRTPKIISLDNNIPISNEFNKIKNLNNKEKNKIRQFMNKKNKSYLSNKNLEILEETLKFKNNKNYYKKQTHGRYCDKSNRNKIIKNSNKHSRILICKKSKKHFFKKGKKLISTLSKKDQERCYNQYCWHKLSMKNKIVHRKKIKNLKKTKKNNNNNKN